MVFFKKISNYIFINNKKIYLKKKPKLFWKFLNEDYTNSFSYS